jgi:hypothetical protein
MPIVDTRTALKNALASVTASVYDHVPESVIPPAVVVVPDSPYAELETISKTTIRTKLNYTLTLCVAYHSNAAALDNLERFGFRFWGLCPPIMLSVF